MSNTDLFEDGVSYLVDQTRTVIYCHIVAIAFLQIPFQFEVTGREIEVILLRIDLKVDLVDPCGERVNGDHAITHYAEISGGIRQRFNMGLLTPADPGRGTMSVIVVFAYVFSSEHS